MIKKSYHARHGMKLKLNPPFGAIIAPVVASSVCLS